MRGGVSPAAATGGLAQSYYNLMAFQASGLPNRSGECSFDAELLAQIDAPALVAYCQSYATWCEAQQEIRRSGTVI